MMKFLHLTDIHYLINYPFVESGYLSIFNDMTNPIIQLQKGLTLVEDYDAVLITGDLVEDGVSADYAALKEILDTVFKETPIVVTLGNHDVKPAFYEGFLGEPCSHAPYHHCVVIGDTTVISLDNSHPHYSQGIINEAACRWLEERLACCETTQIILMMHHHLIDEQISIPKCVYDEAFLTIIKNSRIDMIICGHTHHAYEGTFGGKPYFTADNLSFSGEETPCGYVRFEERSGFNYYELNNRKVVVKTIPVESSRKLLGNVRF